MKKLRLLFCLLVVVCIITSSSTTFSAMPKGKFPIRIMSSRENPTKNERALISELERAFNNSTNFRVTNINEDRIILMLLLDEHIPSVISTDVLATASPINTFSLVWLAKPADKHAYFIWHNSGRYTSFTELSKYILNGANNIVLQIKNHYSYLFN